MGGEEHDGRRVDIWPEGVSETGLKLGSDAVKAVWSFLRDLAVFYSACCISWL